MRAGHHIASFHLATESNGLGRSPYKPSNFIECPYIGLDTGDRFGKVVGAAAKPQKPRLLWPNALLSEQPSGIACLIESLFAQAIAHLRQTSRSPPAELALAL